MSTEPAAGASDLMQPGTAPAKTPAAPETMNIKFHFGQGVAVPEHMKAGAVSPADEARALTAETFRAFGVDEAVLAQRGQAVSEAEYKLAQHKLASLKNDRAWVQRYFQGDTECRRIMGTLSIILGSPIKEASKP
jgi:hypothetical protein